MSDLTTDLSLLLKPALLEEAQARGEKIAALEARIAELEAAPAPAPPADPFQGCTPVRLHVSGSPLANTLVELVRCTIAGESADLWMVVAGGKAITRSGHPTSTGGRPFFAIPAALRDKLAMPFADALKIARKTRVR